MPQGYRRDAGGFSAGVRRALTLTAALVAALALPAPPAPARTLDVSVTFPASIAVGQTGSASVLISNASTFEDPSFTICRSGEGGPCAGSEGIVLTPSCGQVSGAGGATTCAPAGADPGVLQINPPALGAAGTLCDGRSFLVTAIDAQHGRVRLAQTGGQDVILTMGEQCRIDFTVTAMRSPALDGSEQPGAQTLPLATVGARTYLEQPVAGGGSTVLSVAPAPPVAPTVGAVVPDRPSNDNLPEIRGTASAGTVVSVYAGAGCTGAPVATGAASSFAATGLTAAVADNSVTTFAAKTTDPRPGSVGMLGEFADVRRGLRGARDDHRRRAEPRDRRRRPRLPLRDERPRRDAVVPGERRAVCAVRLAAAAADPRQGRIPLRGPGHRRGRNADPTPASRAFGVGTFVQGSSPAGCLLSRNAIIGTPYNDELLGTAASDTLGRHVEQRRLARARRARLPYGQGGTDRLFGGAAADLLYGGPDNDVLDGGSGGDRLSGERGLDRLDGGTGDDRLSGGADNDRLADSRGRDRFSGGAGSDRIDARDGYARDRRARDEVTCGRATTRFSPIRATASHATASASLVDRSNDTLKIGVDVSIGSTSTRRTGVRCATCTRFRYPSRAVAARSQSSSRSSR